MALEYRPFRKGDERALSELFGEVFGWEPIEDYWRWKYFENPAGKHEAHVVADDEKIVGEIAAIPAKVKLGSGDVIASQTCDIVISPRYRKGTPFFRLHRRVTKEVDRRGWEFVFGISVKSTYRISTKTLGFDGAGPVRRLVKILNPDPFIRNRFRTRFLSETLGFLGASGLKFLDKRRLRPSREVEIQEVTNFDSSFDELWERRAHDYEIMVVRDSEYLNWRYKRNPLQEYRTLVAFRNNAPAGLIIFCSRMEKGIKRGYILDLLASPNDDDLIRFLIGQAVLELYSERADIVSMWLFEHTTAFGLSRQMGFALKETPHDLIVRSHGDYDSEYLADRSKWFLTIGDSDYR